MSEETIDDIPLQVLEKFVTLWNDVKEAASVVRIDEFKQKRKKLRDFVKLFPCLKNQRIEMIKELIRDRKINDILRN